VAETVLDLQAVRAPTPVLADLPMGELILAAYPHAISRCAACRCRRALVCFAIGAVLGALWGRRHPSPAAKLDMIISQAKAKE
jgi:hypothetical protein